MYQSHILNQNKDLSSQEKQKLLHEFNPEIKKAPEITIHELFMRQARETPDNIALRYGNKSMTYKELDEKSSKLAQVLQRKGASIETIVGIKVDRSFDMIIGILAILKSGAAYLPIDPGYPEERINYMVENSQARLIITERKFINSNDQKNSAVEYIDMQDKRHYQTSPEKIPTIAPNNLAYVIYTSGSTGRPKGVMVEHRNVVSLLHQMQMLYPIKNSDSYLLKTSFCFDVSVTELFGWIYNGGKLSILKQDEEKDPEAILKKIERDRITHVNFVPSMLKVLLTEKKLLARCNLNSLRYVFSAGEVLSAEVASKFYRTEALENATLENLYGPTEATIFATRYTVPKVPEFSGYTRLPIGNPIPNCKVYILDSRNELAPLGVIGELCISGSGIARGYINNEELNKEKFIQSPFEPLETLYKTGDLARWLPNGNIEFLGRIDSQFKIRGYRIELGEIELQLLTHENINDVFVLVDEKNGEKRVKAYIVDLENTISARDLYDYLSTVLPKYMIPNEFVFVERIPLLSSGKVDKNQLLTLKAESHEKITEVPVGNIVEKKLLNFWKELLNHDDIIIDDDFFEVGGHSLILFDLIRFINEQFDVEFTFAHFKGDITIRTIAEEILNNIKDDMSNLSVIFNKKNAKTIFSFSEISGYGLAYKTLSSKLHEYRVMSFNFVHSEKLINDYVKAILKQNQTGPYILLGYCVGGRIACHVAERLESLGYSIDALILIDTERVTEYNSLGKEELEDHLRWQSEKGLAGQKLLSFREEALENIKRYSRYLNSVKETMKLNCKVHYISSESMDKNYYKLWTGITNKTIYHHRGFGKHGRVLEKNAEIYSNLLREILYCKRVRAKDNSGFLKG